MFMGTIFGNLRKSQLKLFPISRIIKNVLQKNYIKKDNANQDAVLVTTLCKPFNNVKNVNFLVWLVKIKILVKFAKMDSNWLHRIVYLQNVKQ